MGKEMVINTLTKGSVVANLVPSFAEGLIENPKIRLLGDKKY